jgi:hypothetical protein
MSGSNVRYHAGNYGVQGIPAESNMPPYRYDGLGWTDFYGNFWLFGGSNEGNSQDYADMNFC